MKIEKLYLKDFRSFSGKEPETGESLRYEIPLGKNLTCIAGQNAIGKTTILAVLSNCGELKDKKQINGTPFRGEYSRVIKGEKEYDSTGDKAEIVFTGFEKHDDIPPSVKYRATYQRSSKRGVKGSEQAEYRYRLIPKKSEAPQNHERKLSWPVIYLGLSRLYPAGESEGIRTEKSKLTDAEKEFFSHNYRELISRRENIIETSHTKLSAAAPRKVGLGIRTEEYGFLANSSGQDNLGQIIMAVMSFMRLKEEMKDSYRGGLLLIDELDASLHPAVQRKLIEFLKAQSSKLELQVVFTTHSMTIISLFYSKKWVNSHGSSNILNYFRTVSGKLKIDTQPEEDLVKNDLSADISIERPTGVEVLTEDETAGWWLRQILSLYPENIEVDTIGGDVEWNTIANIASKRPHLFSSTIILLDRDVESSIKIFERYRDNGSPYGLASGSKNILVDGERFFLLLPGAKVGDRFYCAELTLFNFIRNDLREDDDIFSRQHFSEGAITLEMLNKAAGYLESESDYESFKEAAKHWFTKWEKRDPKVLEQLVKRWVELNQDCVDDFFDLFKGEIRKLGLEGYS